MGYLLFIFKKWKYTHDLGSRMPVLTTDQQTKISSGDLTLYVTCPLIKGPVHAIWKLENDYLNGVRLFSSTITVSHASDARLKHVINKVCVASFQDFRLVRIHRAVWPARRLTALTSNSVINPNSGPNLTF